MKKKKYHIFRYPNVSDHYYVVVLNTSPRYMEFHLENVKMVKEFDDLKQAVAFRDAMELL